MVTAEPTPDSQLQALWRHPNPTQTEYYKFQSHIEKKYSLSLNTPTSLWQWSVDNIPEFWAEAWDYTGVVASKRFDSVVDDQAPMFPRPQFFAGARLNFAENLLFPKADVKEDGLAVVAATEEGRRSYTWKELREEVRKCQASMEGRVKMGDRVVGYLGNGIHALVAMLAATSLGCIWSGVSPDTGPTAVLERMEQLEPTILFADNAVMYNGKVHNNMAKLTEVLAGLEKLGCLKSVVVVQTFGADTEFNDSLSSLSLPGTEIISYDNYLGSGSPSHKLHFEQLEADTPIYILFSSGTTGRPKCICHGAIGTLLQHKKEHQIHASMTSSSVFFQYTTITWMMWHWLVSGLASGATIVLYDGSPFRPNSHASMPTLINELGVTHFGTSAKYLSLLEQANLVPPPMPTLTTIFSTASPLAPSTFTYIYKTFAPTVHLASITGGTDIISLFFTQNPLLPLYPGQIQDRGLGMAVHAAVGMTPDGTLEEAEAGMEGELVCTKPFPSMPVCFWGPNGLDQYRAAYFSPDDEFAGRVWKHGDFIRFHPQTGGVEMLGRSDGVLNPAGVRFGSAELYGLLLREFSREIEDSVAVGRKKAGGDEDVVLFVVVNPEWDPPYGSDWWEDLEARVRSSIAKGLSLRHVPRWIIRAPEVPVTGNGKKVEVVVKGIVNGKAKVGAAVVNGRCLEFYRQWAERLKREEEEAK
ncbi:acetoacetate-CoA ligase [Ascobolus immersus RN42]|uniref:Acetoacetate-CoA ligase n=1 Tax=Ascobolus immersus RN42 TaxID=1160509 RepID=A0A3N4IF84_ASCIM|nr:acetoacetate-CoA ligase [Ascobolus immersus RN42]